jgi:hypothetical protein
MTVCRSGEVASGFKMWRQAAVVSAAAVALASAQDPTSAWVPNTRSMGVHCYNVSALCDAAWPCRSTFAGAAQRSTYLLVHTSLLACAVKKPFWKWRSMHCHCPPHRLAAYAWQPPPWPLMALTTPTAILHSITVLFLKAHTMGAPPCTTTDMSLSHDGVHMADTTLAQISRTLPTPTTPRLQRATHTTGDAVARTRCCASTASSL